MAHESPTARTEALMTDLARNLPLGDLLALGTQLRADITPETLLQDVADAIRRSLGYRRVYVRLRNADTDELEACAFSGIPEDEIVTLRERPLAPAEYQALLQPKNRLSESYLTPGETTPVPDGPSDHDSGTLLVPLRGRSDRLIGAIYVEPADDLAAIELPNIKVLEAIARQAGLALENARLAARTQRLLAKEQLLVELGREVSDTLDLDVILARTVERLKVEFQGSAIALLNDQNELEIVAAVGRIDEAARNVRLRVGEGICGWVVREGLPFLSNDTWNETRVTPAAHDIGTNQYIRSYIAVPLRTGGRVIGVLTVESDQVNAFTYEDVDLLEAVAAQVVGPISSARLYQEAQLLAEQVRRRNKVLEVINTLARMAVSTLDLERLLATVTAEIQQGFGYGHVELYLVDEERGELELVAQAGTEEPVTPGHRQPLSKGLLGRAYRTAATVRADDVRQEPDYQVNTLADARSELCVPVVASGRVLALLNLESRQVAAFSDEDRAALETAADVLANAIENARLYQRAQEAAVLEERSRLARDLHDSISQQLFSMTLTAQAARAQLEKNPARAAAQLERLQETASAALAEMRALIFQLRPPGLSEQGLIATLQQHVAMLRRREGLTIDLFVSGEERDARGIEQAMYRIAQEALNNVVKHAGACQVEVALDLRPDQVVMSIVDDGRGFEPGAENNGNGRHLGLVSMRERAAELGGRLELQSAPGKGTRIKVIVPRGGKEAVGAAER
ncbi:MAG: GAF domain-containing protein [Chloroflexota bacterium]